MLLRRVLRRCLARVGPEGLTRGVLRGGEGCHRRFVEGARRRQRVSNAALANAALVPSSNNRKKYSRWGAASKIKSKKPWVFSRHAGIDAALVRCNLFFAGAPTIENKIEFKIQSTKVASAKVALDTVRVEGRNTPFRRVRPPLRAP